MSGETKSSGPRVGWSTVVLLSVLLLLPTAAQAQAVGTVVGQVLDGETSRPIEAAQVFLPDLDQGALTNANGQYVILNVPVGTYDISVQRIGLTTVTQSVTVATGQTVVADFQVSTLALGLDEIVVTGTAGQARQREVGNSIVQINVDEEVLAPQPRVETLLQGRAPGVSINYTSGVVGDGAEIRIRGRNSAALSNTPLIYIDGIRVQSDRYDALQPVTLGNQYSHMARPSPLGDLNPQDIERIEIIKGAAATTLYGTEASAGVIQIFTKSGRTGAPEVTAGIDVGFNTKNVNGIQRTLRGTPTSQFDAYNSLSGGTATYMYMEPWMRDAALQQEYSASVRGSQSGLRYFVSGSWKDNEDVFYTAGQDMYSVRGNLGIDVHETVSVEWNTSFSKRSVENIACSDDLWGVCSRSSYGGIVDVPKEDLDFYLDKRHVTEIDRLITGGTIRFQPSTSLSSRLVAGYDRVDNTGRVWVPYGFLVRPGGFNSLTTDLLEMFTLDFVSNYTRQLTSNTTAEVSLGFQRVARDQEKVEGWTENFPGPGETTLSSGAVSLARESRKRVITGGVFGQVLLGAFDRYFLTLGVRADGNSAFGEDFGWQVYPKVSGSWVVSDESFWSETWGQMKLRAAYGWAGRSPDAFDAVRTWQASPWGDEAAFQPSNLGNADLGPERTAELELGFDASTLNDRVELNLTWYRQVTTDALMPVAPAPSEGSWSSQLENIGKLKNWGLELQVTGTPILTRDWRWDLGASISTNHSEITDLGGVPATSSLIEGQPIRVETEDLVLNPNEIADPIIVKDHHFGPLDPTLMIAPYTTLQLPYGVTVSARGEYQGGHWGEDGASKWALIVGIDHYPLCFDAFPLIEQGRADELTALERAQCTRGSLFNNNTFLYPMDYFKLREVSVRIPVGWAIPQASRAWLTLSGANLWRWTKDEFRAWDPEGGGGWTTGSQTSNDMWQNPAPPKRFLLSLRVTF